MFCESWNLDTEEKTVGGNKEKIKEVWDPILILMGQSQ